jgi:hypothetical protein
MFVSAPVQPLRGDPALALRTQRSTRQNHILSARSKEQDWRDRIFIPVSNPHRRAFERSSDAAIFLHPSRNTAEDQLSQRLSTRSATNSAVTQRFHSECFDPDAVRAVVRAEAKSDLVPLDDRDGRRLELEPGCNDVDRGTSPS